MAGFFMRFYLSYIKKTLILRPKLSVSLSANDSRLNEMNAGMMKSTFCMLQCSILSLMSVLAGCNSEVFIDEF